LERSEVLREVRYTSYTRMPQRREPHIADVLLLYLTTKIFFLKGIIAGFKGCNVADENCKTMC